ncbi:hypothetical protein [Streptomyces sp. Isolate_45]|uniref:hypothetical protein n=1 Tax=Streptomyces sp. Isolate_45 TaxID=2950111 RepID=UPI002481B83E|nr:hypothetical protein [Streptomyces sp. Isolate_45]MDA5280909.1 hypothetical protein [Streptomyces sp. Isolate_45]
MWALDINHRGRRHLLDDRLRATTALDHAHGEALGMPDVTAYLSLIHALAVLRHPPRPPRRAHAPPPI